MKLFYLAIQASNAADQPFYCLLHADSDVQACQLAITSLGLDPEGFDIDDRILVSDRRLPIEEQAINCDSFFVWQFIPEVDKLMA